MAIKSKRTKKMQSRKNPRRVRKNKAKKLNRFRDIVPLGLGFPKRSIVTHKYFENVQLLSTSGIPATYQFAANDMYDPNFTGTGHQPMNYDQLCLLYNHWHVIGSKITIKFIPYDNAQPAAQVSCYQNDDNTPLSTDPMVQAEYAGSRYRILSANSTDSVKTIVLKYSAKKTHGGNVLSNTSLLGTVGASPSERTFWTIALKALNGSSTASYFINIKAEYTAVWSELKEVAQS